MIRQYRNRPLPMMSARIPHSRTDRRLALAACVLCAALVAGCTLPGLGLEQGVAPEVVELLPADWAPLPGRQAWVTVNIDGDPLDEHLLFFTYDNGTERNERGPVGAMVVDQSEAGEFLPGSPTDIYRTFPLLPNYFAAHGDTGRIAPSMPPYEIEVRPVDSDGRQADVRTPGAASELLIYGGSTSITNVWWRGQEQGYGVVNIFAPAGFQNTVFIEGDPRAAVTSTVGLAPLWDRSELCHAVRYVRQVGAAPDPAPTSPVAGNLPAEAEPLAATATPTGTAGFPGGDIAYARSSEGIVFCNRTLPPVYPYYPESVVLSYILLPPAGEGRIRLSSPQLPSAAQQEFGELPAGRSWQVMALFAPEQVTIRDRQSALDITVCVEARDWAGEPAQPYLFTLRYVMRDQDNRLPDRLLVQDIWPVTQSQSAIPCEQFVPGGTPGRVSDP